MTAVVPCAGIYSRGVAGPRYLFQFDATAFNTTGRQPDLGEANRLIAEAVAALRRLEASWPGDLFPAESARLEGIVFHALYRLSRPKAIIDAWAAPFEVNDPAACEAAAARSARNG
jgi:hypothetical protein